MSKTIGERELVLAILLEVTRDKIPAHLALSRVLGKYQYLDKRERAFITKVTEGTLEHMIEIDYIIDQFSKIKIQKMKPVVLSILRSGVYQLRYLDHVPASAVCNEAVKLAKERLARFVRIYKRVLQTIARDGHIRLPREAAGNKAICSVFRSEMDGGEVDGRLPGGDGGEDACQYDGRASNLYPV